MNKASLRRPIRVLNVFGGMNRGGAETWMLHVMRCIDRERFQVDFLVHTAKPCAYDEEIKRLGGRIFPCTEHRQPWKYARTFSRIVKTYGPYSVLHSHVHFFSGYPLWLARRFGIPIRVAHSHCMQGVNADWWNLPRTAYLNLSRAWIYQNATHGLAVSLDAAQMLFGDRWERDPRFRVLHCGIDLEPFREAPDPSARSAMGFPADSYVIGHVGRIDQNKNQAYLLKILKAASEVDGRIRLLLVGDGPMRGEIERKAAASGVSGRVRFAGLRNDVPRLLSGAADVFVMPSVSEGLPLAGLEAQAAGLPCIISDSIPRELDVVPNLVQRISLSRPPEEWANAVLATRACDRNENRLRALNVMKVSSFNIHRTVEDLQKLYGGEGC